MERVPVPEDSGRDVATTLRLLEHAHIRGQLEAHERYTLPLGSIVDTISEDHVRDLARLDLLVNRLLMNFDVRPEEWRHRLQPDAHFRTADRIPEAVSASEYLYKGALRNIFSRTDGYQYGGVSLHFTQGDEVSVELRATSQIQQLSIYENPQTERLMYAPEESELIELMRQEYMELPPLFEGVDAELTFTAIFVRAPTSS